METGGNLAEAKAGNCREKSLSAYSQSAAGCHIHGAVAIALLASAVFLLIAGCSGQEGSIAQYGANGTWAAPNGSFLVPDSGLSYTAHYVVSGKGGQGDKTVWRSGRRMRVDFAADGGVGVSLFFLQDRVYSCSAASGTERCFDITSSMGQSGAQDFFLPPDLSYAQDAGPVDIGGTPGRCYTLPPTPLERHEVCLTGTGVLAYEEYNMSSGEEQVEYLSDLNYSAPDSAFVLPAAPVAAPAGQP